MSKKLFNKELAMQPYPAARVAKGYYSAALYLYQSTTQQESEFNIINKNKDIDPIIFFKSLGHSCSATILLALAIEILLKAIIAKHGGEIKQEHDLVKLYKKIPLTLRESFEVSFKGIQSHTTASTDSHMTLMQALKSCKDTFIQIRYRHEHSKFCLSIGSMFQVYDTLIIEFPNP